MLKEVVKIEFSEGTVAYEELSKGEFKISVSGYLYPRQLNTANDMIQSYVEQARHAKRDGQNA